MNRRIPKSLIFLCMFLMVGVCGMILSGRFSYAQSTKTVDNLKFQVPDDWPIEKRGGVVGPIPTDEYVSMKFQKTDEEFKAIRTEIAEKISALQSSLKDMEQKLSEEIQKVQAVPVSMDGAPSGDQSGILARLEEVEKQLARLDRKITNKAAEMKGETEGKFLQIDSFDERISNIQKSIRKLDEEVQYLFDNR